MKLWRLYTLRNWRKFVTVVVASTVLSVGIVRAQYPVSLNCARDMSCPLPRECMNNKECRDWVGEVRLREIDRRNRDQEETEKAAINQIASEYKRRIAARESEIETQEREKRLMLSQPVGDNWNIKDLNSLSNGNVKVAIQALAHTHQRAISTSLSEIRRAPWKFIGRYVSIPGQPGDSREFAPGSSESLTYGGGLITAVIWDGSLMFGGPYDNPDTSVLWIIRGSAPVIQSDGRFLIMTGYPTGYMHVNGHEILVVIEKGE